MKKYLVYNSSGERIKEIELNSKIFGIEIKNSVVHQVAVAQMANSRVAIAHTKDRSEVRGGGVKPWKQKGTGRARHGSTRSPIWVGGGVTFGPTKDRNFSKKVNKKQKTKALFMCLSDKANNDLFILLDELNLENGKTQELIGVIKNLA
ncbi:50S ribosomal protein L4, partial [Patescibacteria group bacterium]|nr:50S ribosomal protein L4 [Patescibacteria group bacterium]